jgi:pimeloyl-ACP methyl ester carboxylesterase
MSVSNYVATGDGRELHHCQWGPADGFPVFVLHGTPGSRYLRHVNGEYERRGVRAVTYDRPGYGLSTRSPGRTVADSAHDVRVIADRLGMDRFAVVGISGGGPSALAVAAAFPDRVSRCATIVGIGPSDADDLELLEGMSEQERQEWAVAMQGEDALRGDFYAQTVGWVRTLADSDDPEPNHSMLIQAFTEGLRTPDGLVDDYASLLAPWGFDLDDVHCPVRVMIAENDVSVPSSHGRWLVDHLADATAVVVPGDHFGPREAEEEALLGWLTG